MCSTYKRNIEACLWNLFCRGKAISITYSECVSVALIDQHWKRMRPVIFSSMASLAVPCFSTLSHKRHDFRGKKILKIKCVFWFTLQHLFETFLILRRTERYVIMHIGFHVKYLLFLSHVNKTWIFSIGFQKILKYKISYKSLQWEQSCSMRTGERTDITKIIDALRSFAKAPKLTRTVCCWE